MRGASISAVGSASSQRSRDRCRNSPRIATSARARLRGGEPGLGERDQVVGDVGGGDVVDVRAPALGQELAEPREVAAVAVERVPREPALDLQVIEEEVDRLVEAQPARHAVDWIAMPRRSRK